MLWQYIVIVFLTDVNRCTCCTKVAAHYRFRRFVWNFFRLENEHLNNCGQFRAVRDISIAPMNSNDQALLEQMMDEEDGVTNRRSAIDRKYRLNAASSRLLSATCISVSQSINYSPYHSLP